MKLKPITYGWLAFFILSYLYISSFLKMCMLKHLLVLYGELSLEKVIVLLNIQSTTYLYIYASLQISPDST